MRAFVFGVLLVACGGEAPKDAMGLATAGSSGEASVGSEGGEAGALSVSSGGAASVAGGMGRSGAPGVAGGASGGQAGSAVAGAGGSAGGATALGGAPGAGSGGAPAAGAASVAGGGSVSAGGSAGSVAAGDPLAPFPAPGCPGFTAYRIPKGSFLAITSGDFELNAVKNGVCEPMQGDPTYARCGALGNVKQCECTVTSPPTCGQYCDGDYLVTAVRAKPGDTLQIKLHEGDGWCVAGVPVKK